MRRNKSKGFFIFLFLFFIIFISIINLSSDTEEETCDVLVKVEKEEIFVSVFLKMKASTKVIESLLQGLKAQIIFKIRLYKKNEGIFSFFGDQLIVERSPVYIAYLDFFEEKYVITENNYPIFEAKEPKEFIYHFFSLTDFKLTDINVEDISDYYILSRIHLDAVRLVAPFNLLSLFTVDESYTTPWTRKEIE